VTFAAVAGHRCGRATPSLRDAPQRQSMERIGRDSIYRDRNAVQTMPATSFGAILQVDTRRLSTNCMARPGGALAAKADRPRTLHRTLIPHGRGSVTLERRTPFACRPKINGASMRPDRGGIVT